MCKLGSRVMHLGKKWNKSRISPGFLAIFMREGRAGFSPSFAVKIGSKSTLLGTEHTLLLQLSPRQKRTKGNERETKDARRGTRRDRWCLSRRNELYFQGLIDSFSCKPHPPLPLVLRGAKSPNSAFLIPSSLLFLQKGGLSFFRWSRGISLRCEDLQGCRGFLRPSCWLSLAIFNENLPRKSHTACTHAIPVPLRLQMHARYGLRTCLRPPCDCERGEREKHARLHLQKE